MAVAACLAAVVPWGARVPERGRGAPGLARAQAQDPAWRREFDEVCSRTQDAMALTPDELLGLIGRCDRLKPALEALEESHRRVFSRRLQACRDLYQFVLDSKRGAG